MTKKLVFPVLLFLGLCGVMFTHSSVANAWSGDLGGCDGRDVSASGFDAHFTSVYGSDWTSPSGGTHSFVISCHDDPTTGNQLWFQYCSGSANGVFKDISGAHVFACNYGSTGFREVYSYYTNSWISPGNTYPTYGNYPDYNTNIANDFVGVVTARNVTYDSSWGSAVHFSNGSITPPPCDPLNLFCWMPVLFGNIVTAIEAMASGLASLITDVATNILGLAASIASAISTVVQFLFVPTQFGTIFNNFNTFFTAKLGFLLYPFTFMSNLFAALLQNQGDCLTYDQGSLVSQSITANFFGQHVNLSLCSASTGVFLPLWNAVKLIITSLTLFALMFAIRSKYLEVVKG